MGAAMIATLPAGPYRTEHVARLIGAGRYNDATRARAQRLARIVDGGRAGNETRQWSVAMVRWVLTADALVADSEHNVLGHERALQLTVAAVEPAMKWVVIVGDRAVAFDDPVEVARMVTDLGSTCRVVVVPEVPETPSGDASAPAELPAVGAGTWLDESTPAHRRHPLGRRPVPPSDGGLVEPLTA
jgi:hypothetical protein